MYESVQYSPQHPDQLTYANYTDRLQFISHEEGRVRFELANLYSCSPTQDRLLYDYFVKDHLGNVRMVLTEAGEPVCYPAATLESTSIAKEKQLYDIKDAQVKDVSLVGGASTYTQFQSKLYETNGSPGVGKKTGLGIALKVMAGDQVNILGQSYYNRPVGGSNTNGGIPVTELLNAFVGSGAVAGAKGVVDATSVYDVPSNSTPLTSLMNPSPSAGGANASINYILFDEQMRCIRKRWIS